MKTKLALLVIAGLVGLPLASFAQASSSAGEESSAAAAATEVATAPSEGTTVLTAVSIDDQPLTDAPDAPHGFAAVPFSGRGGHKLRFNAEGQPLCQAELAMPPRSVAAVRQFHSGRT